MLDSNIDSVSKIYVIFGLPGAGKGTCSQALKERRGYEHLSLGDFLRKEVNNESEIGIQYKDVILNGLQLIPSHVVQGIIKNKFLETIQYKKNLIVDGFPRTIEQAEFLVTFTKQIGINPHYVHISVDPELAIKRLLTRESCDVCAHVYMIIPPKVPGICDLCGGTLSKRLTDNRERILERMQLFEKTTRTAIDYFVTNKMMITIDANKPLKELVEEFLKFV